MSDMEEKIEPGLRLAASDGEQIDLEEAIARAPSPPSQAGADLEALPAQVIAPLSMRDTLFRIAKGLAHEHGFDPTDAELYSLVDEQFLPDPGRSLARYHRKADEMLCQALERDRRFIDMIGVAKGEVF